MNEQLLKFIELCLIDGVISDKEREVIFRKANELGVPDDECQIILEAMVDRSKPSKGTSKEKYSSIKSTEILIESSPEDLTFKKDLTKRIKEFKEGIQSKIDVHIEEIEQLNKDKALKEESLNEFIKYLDSNVGKTLRFRRIESVANLQEYCGLKFYEFYPHNSDSNWFFESHSIWFDQRNFCFIVLFDYSADIVYPYVSEFNNRYWARENIGNWKIDIVIQKKLFSTQYGMRIEDLNFSLNEDASFVQEFYKKVKSRYNFKGLKAIQESIDESQTSITELNLQLSLLEEFSRFFSDNNDVISDLLRSSSISQILTTNYPNLSAFDKEVSNLTRLEKHILKKREIILDNFNIIEDYVVHNYVQELMDLIVNGVNELNCLIYHTINMLTALINDDLLTYNRIYEKLDDLQVFNSTWEQNLRQELSELNSNVQLSNARLEIMNRNITRVGSALVEGLSRIEQITQSGFSNLNISIKSVNDSINFNNLLTGVQLYHTYKINKNTKPLKS